MLKLPNIISRKPKNQPKNVGLVNPILNKIPNPDLALEGEALLARAREIQIALLNKPTPTPFYLDFKKLPTPFNTKYKKEMESLPSPVRKKYKRLMAAKKYPEGTEYLRDALKRQQERRVSNLQAKKRDHEKARMKDCDDAVAFLDALETHISVPTPVKRVPFDSPVKRFIKEKLQPKPPAWASEKAVFGFTSLVCDDESLSPSPEKPNRKRR